MEGKLHPADLKPAVAKVINELIEPVRQHFKNNAEARNLLNLINSFKQSTEAPSANKVEETEKVEKVEQKVEEVKEVKVETKTQDEKDLEDVFA